MPLPGPDRGEDPPRRKPGGDRTVALSRPLPVLQQRAACFRGSLELACAPHVCGWECLQEDRAELASTRCQDGWSTRKQGSGTAARKEQCQDGGPGGTCTWRARQTWSRVGGPGNASLHGPGAAASTWQRSDTPSSTPPFSSGIIAPLFSL